MQVIYKYKLNMDEKQKILIRKNFKPLRVDYQNGVLCMWALVDLSEDMNSYYIHIIGTGWEFDTFKDFKYISTVFHGSLVWHIFYDIISVEDV